MAQSYSVGQYRDPDTGRTRWAVWACPSQVWYFATRYGRKAADALAVSLTRKA